MGGRRGSGCHRSQATTAGGRRPGAGAASHAPSIRGADDNVHQGSWLAFGRVGYMGLIFQFINQGDLPKPYYEDAFGKMSFRLTPKQELVLEAQHARDKYVYGIFSTTGFLDTINTTEHADNHYGNQLRLDHAQVHARAPHHGAQHAFARARHARARGLRARRSPGGAVLLCEERPHLLDVRRRAGLDARLLQPRHPELRGRLPPPARRRQVAIHRLPGSRRSRAAPAGEVPDRDEHALHRQRLVVRGLRLESPARGRSAGARRRRCGTTRRPGPATRTGARG